MQISGNLQVRFISSFAGHPFILFFFPSFILFFVFLCFSIIERVFLLFCNTQLFLLTFLQLEWEGEHGWSGVTTTLEHRPCSKKAELLLEKGHISSAPGRAAGDCKKTKKRKEEQ